MTGSSTELDTGRSNYRFSPGSWGKGPAAEAARQALVVAHRGGAFRVRARVAVTAGGSSKMGPAAGFCPASTAPSGYFSTCLGRALPGWSDPTADLPEAVAGVRGKRWRKGGHPCESA
jgi:hypothetical protein